MRLTELHTKDFDLEKFQKECQPFLDAIRGATQILYHGTHYTVGDWAIDEMKYRTRSRDTALDLHKSTNEFFEEKFGHPCRNWMFTTSKIKSASIYGKAYVIFPRGEFKFLWSPAIEDFTGTVAEFENEIRMNDRSMNYIAVQKKAKEMMAEFIRQPGVWKFNGDIKGALQSGNEIMLDCESFYMMRATETYWDVVHPWMMDKGYLA